jgi:hypothetical protein
VTAPTVHRSLIEVEYSGADNLQPSRTPGHLAGGISGLLAAISGWMTVPGRAKR